MKKTLTIFGVMMTFLVLSSCTKDYYHPRTSKTFLYTVNSDDWDWNGTVTKQIFHHISLPELTDYYVDQGVVSVAISFDDDASYNVIPATMEGWAYSVNYTRGRVSLYAEDPIFENSTTVPIPGRIYVKITLTEADFIN